MITVNEYATAEEFVIALSTGTAPFNSGRVRNELLFRGQADANWNLRASALRPNTGFYIRQKWVRLTAMSHYEQVEAEWLTLTAFYAATDELGLAVPEDSQELRDILTKDVPRMLGDPNRVKLWPPRKALSLIALAQHFQIPTRLTDWSVAPYVAAYFAAREAARWIVEGCIPPNAERMAVWWLSTLKLLDYQLKFAGAQAPILEMVSAPEFGNPNLHAQSGAFVVYNQAQQTGNAIVDRRGLEEIFPVVLPDVELFKYTLPLSEAPKLLKLLANTGVHAGTLHPGYGGAVASMNEERYWDTR